MIAVWFTSMIVKKSEQIYLTCGGLSERKWTKPITPVHNCLSSHLTMFKFREYGGSKNKLELTVYSKECKGLEDSGN
ncbi:hypothetical protein AAZX31_13G260400 [Glycine max]